MEVFASQANTSSPTWHQTCLQQDNLLHRHACGATARSRTGMGRTDISCGSWRLGQPFCRQKPLLRQLRRAVIRQHRVRVRSHTVYAAAASISDPYKVLGVEISATDQLIKKAFKQKAKQLHPDVNKAVSESSNALTVAWLCQCQGTRCYCSQMLQTGSWNAKWLTSC